MQTILITVSKTTMADKCVNNCRTKKDCQHWQEALTLTLITNIIHIC